MPGQVGFRDPQLHRAALLLVLVPHGGRVAGARATRLRVAPVTWRLLPGRALPGAASGAEAGAGAASRSRPARPESGGWNVTAPGRSGERGLSVSRGRAWRTSRLCAPGPRATLLGTWEHPLGSMPGVHE